MRLAVRQILAVRQSLVDHPDRLGHQNPVVPPVRLDHPGRRGRYASDAWDAVRPEEAEDVSLEHPGPAAVAAQR